MRKSFTTVCMAAIWLQFHQSNFSSKRFGFSFNCSPVICSSLHCIMAATGFVGQRSSSEPVLATCQLFRTGQRPYSAPVLGSMTSGAVEFFHGRRRFMRSASLEVTPFKTPPPLPPAAVSRSHRAGLKVFPVVHAIGGTSVRTYQGNPLLLCVDFAHTIGNIEDSIFFQTGLRVRIVSPMGLGTDLLWTLCSPTRQNTEVIRICISSPPSKSPPYRSKECRTQ